MIKFRVAIIRNTACYFGLYQFDYTISNINLLEFVFVNFCGMAVFDSIIDFITPGNHHSSVIIEFNLLILTRSHVSCLFHNYTHCDYAMLFQIFSTRSPLLMMQITS
jgi:hypothetical protein